MPPQQGGYNMHPSFGGFINDPTAQLGFQMGKSAVDAGQQYVEQNVRDVMRKATAQATRPLPMPCAHHDS